MKQPIKIVYSMMSDKPRLEENIEKLIIQTAQTLTWSRMFAFDGYGAISKPTTFTNTDEKQALKIMVKYQCKS